MVISCAMEGGGVGVLHRCSVKCCGEQSALKVGLYYMALTRRPQFEASWRNEEAPYDSSVFMDHHGMTLHLTRSDC